MASCLNEDNKEAGLVDLEAELNHMALQRKYWGDLIRGLQSTTKYTKRSNI